MTTVSIAYGTDVQMTLTALDGQASSATAGWESDRVDNQTALKAVDYEVQITLDFDATAAANDKAVYVYAVPWFYDGTAWHPGADLGTTTALTGGQADCTLGATHNLRLAKVINYTATGQVVYSAFNLVSVFGSMPDGWSLVLINYTGAAIASSGNIIQYRPINYVSA